MKYVVCYSGGHASALCAVEAVRHYGRENVILLNHGICGRVEHPDIQRFKDEVAAFLGLPITPASMEGFEEKDRFDVCMEIKAFKCGNQSTALCTNRLKTEPFRLWLSENFPASKENPREDIVVLYGFSEQEVNRMKRRTEVMSSMGYKVDFPLVNWDRTIFAIEEIGIARPSTYRFRKHANCSGCLKGGKQAWYVTYCTDPEIFDKAKKAEEKIGHSILKDTFLCDIEALFYDMKTAGVEPTELIPPARFWADAKKKVAEARKERKVT